MSCEEVRTLQESSFWLLIFYLEKGEEENRRKNTGKLGTNREKDCLTLQRNYKNE